MEMVGHQREREAGLFRSAGKADEIEGSVLLARQRVPDLHDDRRTRRPQPSNDGSGLGLSSAVTDARALPERP
jgi:hypothetical protein